MSGPKLRRVLVVAGAVGVVLPAATGVAGAHGWSPGTAVPATAVVLASAVVGVASGLCAVYWHSRLAVDALTDRRFTLALGVGLAALGVSFLLPVTGDRPALAAGGAAVGVAAARLLPAAHAGSAEGPPGSFAGGVLAGVAAHRVFEGVVLAAGLHAGATAGAASALVVTVHAAGETAVVGGLYALAGRPRTAVLAVLGVQGGFLAAATVAATAPVGVPAVARSAVLAAVAGVLLYAGLHECRHCYVDRRGSTS